MKQHVKLVGQVLKNGSEHSGVTSTDLNQTAKRVLRNSIYLQLDGTCGWLQPVLFKQRCG